MITFAADFGNTSYACGEKSKLSKPSPGNGKDTDNLDVPEWPEGREDDETILFWGPRRSSWEP